MFIFTWEALIIPILWKKLTLAEADWVPEVTLLSKPGPGIRVQVCRTGVLITVSQSKASWAFEVCLV